MIKQIPEARIGSIGGSGNWTERFPEDRKRPEAQVVQVYAPVETPYGLSAPFKLLEIGGKPVIHFGMHGWDRKNPQPTWKCSAQVAWIFQQAGVEWAFVNGSVGGVQNPYRPGEPLEPWSVIITTGLIQHWTPPEAPPVLNEDRPYRRMRELFCASLRHHLYESACRQERFTVYERGTYVCTPPYRFETPEEIVMIAGWGGHFVGQTLGHEMPLLKQLGMHVASLNIVSNYAEGNPHWVGDDSSGAMANFYHECAPLVSDVLIDAYLAVLEHGIGECHCNDYLISDMRVFPVEGA